MSDTEIKDPAAVLAALERAKADAKKYREDLEALQAEHEPLKAELGTLKGQMKDSAIKRAIKDAGADPERVYKFLKADGITYNEGNLEGFEEAFSTLKSDLPELFDPKRRVGGRIELETGDANIQKSVTEMQVDRLMNNLKRG